jgi:hypothetical protein
MAKRGDKGEPTVTGTDTGKDFDFTYGKDTKHL